MSTHVYVILTFLYYFLQQVNMKLAKFDELDTLIKGILFAEIQNRTECYYYENARDIM